MSIMRDSLFERFWSIWEKKRDVEETHVAQQNGEESISIKRLCGYGTY